MAHRGDELYGRASGRARRAPSPRSELPSAMEMMTAQSLNMAREVAGPVASLVGASK